MCIARDVSAVACELGRLLLSSCGFSRLEVGLAEATLAVAARLASVKLQSKGQRKGQSKVPQGLTLAGDLIPGIPYSSLILKRSAMRYAVLYQQRCEISLSVLGNCSQTSYRWEWYWKMC